MYKPEIVAGLKNAMDRGVSLEEAIQSFINSGYSKDDVLESADYLKGSPQLLMQVTPPDQTEEKPKKPRFDEEKRGFFQNIRLPHVHIFPLKRKVEEIQSPTVQEVIQPSVPPQRPLHMPSPAEKPQSALPKIQAPVQKVAPLPKLPQLPKPVSFARPAAPVQLGIPAKKELPRHSAVALPEKESHHGFFGFGKHADEKKPAGKKIQKIEKHEKSSHKSTPVLGLPKSQPRKSDNAVFIVLIILLVMLLGALLFSFFYREKLLEIIKQLLGE